MKNVWAKNKEKQKQRINGELDIVFLNFITGSASTGTSKLKQNENNNRQNDKPNVQLIRI